MRNLRQLLWLCTAVIAVVYGDPGGSSNPPLKTAPYYNALAGVTCTWQGANTPWESASNWSCGHIPASDDDVVITASGTPPVLSSNVTINSLSLSGTTFTVKTSAVLNGGDFTVVGNATVQNNGQINMPLVVAAGTLQAGGTWNGDASVAAGAKLTVAANMTVKGSMAVDGALDDKDGTQVLLFGGSLFRNDGLVQASQVRFNRAGQQSIAGSGQWLSGGQVRTVNGSTTALANDLLLETGLYIEGGSTFDLAGYDLTMKDASFYSMCLISGRVARFSGSGALRTQGSVPLFSCGKFSPALEVETGQATVSTGVFSGTVSVLAGATLEVSSPQVTVHGDVTVDGTLSGTNTAAKVTFKGSTFADNGAVTIDYLDFDGADQTLLGSGYLSANNTAGIRPGASLALGSDHRMGKITIPSTGSFDLNQASLTVLGGGVPLVNSGLLATAGSTIIYAGLTAQSLAYLNVHYHHLVISNTVAVNAPNASVAIGGDFTNSGAFLPGSGTMTFDGQAPQAIGGSATTFANLAINNPSGVNLATDATATGILSLNGDLFTGENVLTAQGTSAGEFDVFGRVRRSGFVAGQAYAFGSPHVRLTFTSGSIPTEVTVELSKTPPANLATSVQRLYTITAAGGGGSSATLRLHYRESELNGIDESRLRLWYADQAGTSWHEQGKTAWDLAANWVECSGVYHFSKSDFRQWALAPAGSVYLPLIVR